jgi:hypothetical protein
MIRPPVTLTFGSTGGPRVGALFRTIGRTGSKGQSVPHVPVGIGIGEAQGRAVKTEMKRGAESLLKALGKKKPRPR